MVRANSVLQSYDRDTNPHQPKDEADTYLQQRNVLRYDNNGALLQQLEYSFLLERKGWYTDCVIFRYFSGIVFFTTNHVKVIDKAFKSRIHLSLHYPSLTSAVRRSIWYTFLERAGADTKAITQAQWRYLKSLNLNGREIKNVVRTTQDFTLDRETPITFADVQEVLVTLISAREKLSSWWQEWLGYLTGEESTFLCMNLMAAQLLLLTLWLVYSSLFM